MIPCEGCVHVIISDQQLLYQLFIRYSGNQINDLVLHLFTRGVQLLLTETEIIGKKIEKIGNFRIITCKA